jgi:23S rRNA-/tRNA-specific pseudouridylate synthase
MEFPMERKPRTKVDAASAGTNLEDWLARRFTYLSLEGWRAMIEAGRLLVDEELAALGTPLRPGQVVEFVPPPCDEPPVDMEIVIHWEDEDFIVVSKRGSLPCHPSGRFFAHSLWAILRQSYPEARIATRLDRETSGLVLACKSSSAAALAGRMIVGARLKKSYLALVHGAFGGELAAEGYLVKDESSSISKKRRFVPGGYSSPGSAVAEARAESCSTSFIPLETKYSEDGAFSLVEVHARTGKTHQIRATLLALGYPIVGDKLYGRDEGAFLRFAEGRTNEEDPKRLLLPNQALHCDRLSFVSRRGEALDIQDSPGWGYPYTLFNYPSSHRRP